MSPSRSFSLLMTLWVMANSFVGEVAGCYLNSDCRRCGWNTPDIAEELSIRERGCVLLLFRRVSHD